MKIKFNESTTDDLNASRKRWSTMRFIAIVCSRLVGASF